MWHIELLGGLSVRQEACTVTHFGTRKAAMLLARLALSTRPQPREVLIDLLWPESRSEDLRHNLRQAVHSLRKALEPNAKSEAAVIGGDNTHLWLRSGAFVTDVARFEAALKEAEKATTLEVRREKLSEALELYRGELLPGCYEEWIEGERRRLALLHLGALRQMSALREAAGDPIGAAQFRAQLAALGEEDEALPGVLPDLPAEEPFSGEPTTSFSLSTTSRALESATPFRQEEASTGPASRRVWRMIPLLLVCLVAIGLLLRTRYATREQQLPSFAAPDPSFATGNDFESLLRQVTALRSDNDLPETEQARQERRRRHAALCREIGEMAWNAWHGPEEQVWVQRLTGLSDDMKAALQWSLTNDPEGALQLSGALTRYWLLNNARPEARSWQEQALAKGRQSESRFRARVLTELTLFTYDNDGAAQVEANLAEAERLCRKNDDRYGEARVLFRRGLIANAKKDCARSYAFYRQALERFRQIDDKRGQAITLSNLCDLAENPIPGENLDRLIVGWSHEGLRLFRRIGNEVGIADMMRAYEEHILRLEKWPAGRPLAPTFKPELLKEYREQIAWEHQHRRPEETWHFKRLHLAFAIDDLASVAEELAWYALKEPDWKETDTERIRHLLAFGAYLRLLETLPSPPPATETPEQMKKRLYDLHGQYFRNLDHDIETFIRQGRALPLATLLRQLPTP